MQRFAADLNSAYPERRYATGHNALSRAVLTTGGAGGRAKQDVTPLCAIGMVKMPANATPKSCGWEPSSAVTPTWSPCAWIPPTPSHTALAFAWVTVQGCGSHTTIWSCTRSTSFSSRPKSESLSLSLLRL